MRRALHAMFFGLLLLAAAASKATEDTPDGATPSSEGSAVEPAPGGGEMLILAPRLRHVLHGAVGADGRPEIDCDHPPTPAPGPESR